MRDTDYIVFTGRVSETDRPQRHRVSESRTQWNENETIATKARRTRRMIASEALRLVRDGDECRDDYRNATRTVKATERGAPKWVPLNGLPKLYA